MWTFLAMEQWILLQAKAFLPQGLPYCDVKRSFVSRLFFFLERNMGSADPGQMTFYETYHRFVVDSSYRRGGCQINPPSYRKYSLYAQASHFWREAANVSLVS
ncbi:hypothetical protein AVEN_141691-1 [Araneus ventricosus]|uniref:Uncharacterized protein n=1 Tax=Araneus ventricosus TaxID=182803 RepID=A0A4Y2JL45_ARAVE|nr:hypothetical protein AVEN_141691-1 [Araneus ventricosus]